MSIPDSGQLKVANYGTWDSPISAEKIVEGSATILNMLVENDLTYWCETRPGNKGRYTIVLRTPDGHLQDLTPPDFNARTLVHEYGGGAFAVDNGIVYSSNAADHAIYKIMPNSDPVKLTEGQIKVNEGNVTSYKGTRFADMRPTKFGLVAVGEYHSPGKPVENFLALIDTKTGEYTKLTSGYDFYSSPAVSSDGEKLAWICWNHPNMPWTSTQLWFADFTKKGTLTNIQRVESDNPESVFQPQWSKDGVLYFVSDRDSGWWNIHCYNNGYVENICRISAEVAEPLWVFDRSTYAFLGNKIIFTFNLEGSWQLGVLNIETRKWNTLTRNSQTIHQLRAGKGFVQFLESTSTESDALIQLDDLPGFPTKVLRSEVQVLDNEDISIAEHITYSSGNRVAYGFYYPPKNKHFVAPVEEKPPLIVMIHGGPTAQARGSFNLKLQYWTTRGFAVLDVNYGGSTGYGRAYRGYLDHSWGIVDVEDCENGALFLVQQGLVDPNKIVIRGGSSGGFTTLAALTLTKTFKAGANYFGIADITVFADDTHKFEARYIDQLIGKYPETKAIWEARSPLRSVDKITSPLIIFQGEDDKIVPKNQSILIYDALKKRGIPTEIYIYPGEEHGFRQAVNIVHSLNREKEFYLETFGLKPKGLSK